MAYVFWWGEFGAIPLAELAFVFWGEFLRNQTRDLSNREPQHRPLCHEEALIEIQYIDYYL